MGGTDQGTPIPLRVRIGFLSATHEDSRRHSNPTGLTASGMAGGDFLLGQLGQFEEFPGYCNLQAFDFAGVGIPEEG